jgi:imidazolonepropionase-like amidohydrolase
MPTARHATRLRIAALLLAACAAPALAQPAEGDNAGRRRERAPSTFFKGARVLTMQGAPIDNATIQVSNGQIRRIAPDISIPDGATVIDASGLTITPGLIDADASLGVSYATRGGTPDPTNHAFDAFDRYALDSFKDAVRNGVTTLSISPRTGNGITGTSAIVRLQPGADGPWAGALVKDETALCIDLASADIPTARLDTLDRVRRQLRAASDYRDAQDTYKEELEEYEKKLKERADKEKAGADKKPEGNAPATPPKDAPPAPGGSGGGGGEKKEDELKKPGEPAPDRRAEVLLRALDRQLPVRIRCARSEDIFNALDLAREFNLNIIIDGAAEAHLVAPELADAKASVVLGTALAPGFFQNSPYHRRSPKAVNALRDAGVPFAIGSGRGGAIDDSPAAPSASRFVLANAQLVAQQSDADLDPLKLVTADAADFLAIADKVGRLRQGLAADLVLWTGDPLDPSSRVKEVYIGGELVYRNEDPANAGGQR